MIKIKAEYHGTAVAFGNSGSVLSKRSQSDLLDLAIIAQDSQDRLLLRFFEDLPSLNDLRRMKMEQVIKEHKIKSTNSKKGATKKK